MDRRTRELERRWRQSGDIYDQAALLKCLIRAGLLERRRVLCAGFFGHKASRLALPESIKRRKILVGIKVLKTEELNDWIENIFYWPRDVYLRAILAAGRLAQEHIISKRIAADIKIINKRYEEYIIDSSTDKLEQLQTARRRRLDWWAASNGAYNGRQVKLRDGIVEMYILENSNTRSVKLLGAQFKDKIFRKAIGEGTVPYLLGAWK